MNEKSQVGPVVDDASTFIHFVNIVGDISQTLYLAKHPEENDLSMHLDTEGDCRAQIGEYPGLYAPCHTNPQEAYL